MIAKLATTRAKPAGVHVVPPGTEQDFLNQLELADLPGVGPSLVDALRKRGLVRVQDAVRVQVEWLERWFGQQRGAWLYRRIRGIDDSRVDPAERRRSISSERTFFTDLDEDEALEQRLLELSGSVGGTLRKKGFRARTVTVKLRDHDFKTRQHSRTLPEPIESNTAIYEISRALLRELRSTRRVRARLVGVGLTGLVPADEAYQLGLFEESLAGETERERTVSKTVDALADRFGQGTLVPGRMIGRSPGGRPDSESER